VKQQCLEASKRWETDGSKTNERLKCEWGWRKGEWQRRNGVWRWFM